jgi:hypothetical protein
MKHLEGTLFSVIVFFESPSGCTRNDSGDNMQKKPLPVKEGALRFNLLANI